MKGVDTITRVPRAYFVQGKSIKQIERELHVACNTVRKLIRSGETSSSDERGKQPLPRIGPWQAELDRLLLADEGNPINEDSAPLPYSDLSPAEMDQLAIQCRRAIHSRDGDAKNAKNTEAVENALGARDSVIAVLRSLLAAASDDQRTEIKAFIARY